jgi:hypothetical protein
MMGFFNKKQRPVAVEVKCPAEGCGIIFNDKWELKRHIEWKHPELAGNEEKIIVEAD